MSEFEFATRERALLELVRAMERDLDDLATSATTSTGWQFAPRARRLHARFAEELEIALQTTEPTFREEVRGVTGREDTPTYFETRTRRGAFTWARNHDGVVEARLVSTWTPLPWEARHLPLAPDAPKATFETNPAVAD